MSLPAQLNFSRRRRLPLVLASEAAECGLACIAMIARYHGHDVDLNGLRQRFTLSMSGISLRSLMGLADQLGFSARPLRVELSALSKVQKPAILHWDLNHFVVLSSITGNKAVIHDPGIGVRTLPMAEVSKHFTGVVLELTPAAGFRPVRAAGADPPLQPVVADDRHGRRARPGASRCRRCCRSPPSPRRSRSSWWSTKPCSTATRIFWSCLALAFGALVVVQASVEALRGWALRVFGHLLSFQIVGNLVRHMMRLPADFFEKRHVGDILSRIGAVQPIQDAITRGVAAAIIDGVMGFIAAAILFFYSVTLAAIVVFAALLHLALVFAIYPGMRHRMEEEILARAKEQSHLMESVRAATIIKLMGREAERESSWRNLFAEVTNAEIAVGKYQIGMSLHPDAAVRPGQRDHHLSRGAADPGRPGILGRHAVRLPVVPANLQRTHRRLHQSAGPIPPAWTASRPPRRHRHRRSRNRGGNGASASTSRAQSGCASCRSVTGLPTSSCCRTSISR